MARAIDSEAAYRFLSEQLVKETGAFSKGVNKGLNIARSAMRNPDAIPTLTPPNEWVSVEERLPERGKDVLLYFGEESRISVGGRYDVGDGWYAVIVNEYETICDTSPRYWMPLPAPPDRRPPEGEA